MQWKRLFWYLLSPIWLNSLILLDPTKNRDEPNLGGHAHTHHNDLSTHLSIGPTLQLHILIKPNLLLSEKEENPHIPIVTL